jgi:hypothetical protein
MTVDHESLVSVQREASGGFFSFAGDAIGLVLAMLWFRLKDLL